MSKPPPLPSASKPPPPLPEQNKDVSGLRFDAALNHIGFTHNLVRMRCLEFSGAVEGQEMTGRLEARTRTKYAGEIRTRTLSGFRLYVDIPLPTNGRLIVSHKAYTSRLTRWINRKGNSLPVALPESLPNLEAWAADVAWAERLLQDEEVATNLAILLPDSSYTKNHSLQWYTDKLGYSSFGGRGSHARLIGEVVTGLAAVSQRSAALPRPTIEHQPGWMERRPKLLMALIFGGFILFAILGTALLMLLALVVTSC